MSKKQTDLFELSQPLQKTNHGQKSLSYVSPSIWNKWPDLLKTAESQHKKVFFFWHNAQ